MGQSTLRVVLLLPPEKNNELRAGLESAGSNGSEQNGLQTVSPRWLRIDAELVAPWLRNGLAQNRLDIF